MSAYRASPARDRREHATQHHHTVQSAVRPETDHVPRIERHQHLGSLNNGGQAEQRDDHESDQHQGPKTLPMLAVPRV